MKPKNRELYFQDRDLSDIPFHVLEDAYWRPQDAHLQKHFREKYEESNKKDKIKEYQRLQKFWRQRETWINYSLDCLLMASSPKLLHQVFSLLVPGISLTNPRLFKSDIPGLKADIGVPDFILKAEDGLILGEIKTDALEKSHKYSFEQYSKFMLFSALCLCSTRKNIPDNIVHLIVSPASDAKSFCNDYEQWIPSIDSNRLHADADKLSVIDRKKRYIDFPSWKKYLLDFLNDQQLIEQNNLSKEKIEYFAGISTLEIVPTYLFSWQEFCGVYASRAEENGATNLATSATKILSLASPVTR